MSTYRQLLIKEVKFEAPLVKSFVLEPADGEPMPYQPGQFLTFIFVRNGHEARRSYSISSNRAWNEALTITFKRIENGEFSRVLFDHFAPGDLLLSLNSTGFFTLPQEINTLAQVVFLAAGSGITPILPLIKECLLHEHLLIHLMYSEKSKEQCVFYHELNDLSRRYPNRLRISYYFSTNPDLKSARLNKFTLADQVQGMPAPLRDNTFFFLCGPFAYMQMVNIILLREGVTKERILKENFSTLKRPVKETPPDTLPHMVHLRYEDKVYDIEVQYPDTILKKALKQGIPLPYSCEAGKCGACSATCISGKVWMENNEVLTDREIGRGRVLTCVGYPVEGDVELMIK